jgi:hypothetical protein
VANPDERNIDKCLCGCEEVEEITTDTISGIPCEIVAVCKRCRLTLGNWAYGNWMP